MKEGVAPEVIPPDGEEEAPQEVVLKGLCILPPLQKEGTLTWDEMEDAILLPPIRVEESVTTLRAALGEVCGYAHFGNYRFVLEPGEGATPPKGSTSVAALISPYTGPNAVVSLPAAIKSLNDDLLVPPVNGNVIPDERGEIVLDEYADLTPMLGQGLKDGSRFRLVLERYDVATVREQVVRVRLLLDGNAPSVTSLTGELPVKASGDVQEEAEDSAETSKIKKDTEKDKKTKLEDIKVPEIPKNRIEMDGSNLNDFYYLSCGEEDSLYENSSPSGDKPSEASPKKKKNKGKKKHNDAQASIPVISMQATERRLNELEEQCRVKCTIRYSGFHPPPQSRRLLGDLCYLEVVPPAFPDEPILCITAIPMGFYVNRSKVENESYKFDPSPAADLCFSHELLDCILRASESTRQAWQAALDASKERAELNASAVNDNPLFSLHRVAVRGNYGGYQHSSTATVSQDMDAMIYRPSWLVPMPRDLKEDNAWNYNSLHDYNPARVEDDLANTFGFDMRAGPQRDWNEELQSAREMPSTSLLERMERARLIYKLMADFGEAALLGVKGICENRIAPMNPNEPTRSHVYLHNNIFFSRAIDSGVETFKVATGDKCARKAASRDAQCVGNLHRLDLDGLHTLATVLVDYLGTRFVCQSIVPGILNGVKAHKLLYGTVEASSPLAWDKDMHQLLENTIGKLFMIASRPVPTKPLTDERSAYVEAMKVENPFLSENDVVEEEKDLPAVRNVCGPIEAKGIRGSDQRKYVLDLTRLAPRDANWVPQIEGGTGKWESVYAEELTSNGKMKLIPETLGDEEWTMAVLRPELVKLYSHKNMAEYLAKKKELEEKSEGEKGSSSSTDSLKETAGQADDGAESNKNDESAESKENEETPGSKKEDLTPEDHEYMKSMRLNVNLFLPNIKSVAEIDDSFKQQLDGDKDRLREVSLFLWDTVLPKLTTDIRDGLSQQNQIDGASLTEMLHNRGINCRYLGRLASLAIAEEQRDQNDYDALKHGPIPSVPRKVMPLCWLELLECEMVARSAKHVLDSYLTENGGAAAAQPAQTVASFLSALVSMSEETAGETETRVRKDPSMPDEDDLNALTVFDVGGDGDALPGQIRSRKEVWDDIELDVARRFRYTLSLYNQSGAAARDRALYTPLLRRICQRTGVRLIVKTYAVGGKCLCSTGITFGGRVVPSYPISPLDIVEIVPLVKHAAAHGGEGFVPCSTSPNVMLPSLHIPLLDAKVAIEKAHALCRARALPRALDLAQQAAQLYQRVTDSPMHTSILRCLDLTSAVLYEGGEHQAAAGNAARALALSVQLGGFDSAETLACHTTLSHIFLSSGNIFGAVKHLRASIYLMELLGGPHYAELSGFYSKLGTIYHQLQQHETALEFFEAASRRPSPDRISEGMLANRKAVVLASLGQFKDAVKTEKLAYQFYAKLLGEEHEMTKRSGSTLQNLTKLAVVQGSKQVTEAKAREEEAAAIAIAIQIEAEEELAEKKKKSKKNKKKK